MVMFAALSLGIAFLLPCCKEREGRMEIRTIPVGPLESNCYIVADEKTGKSIIIDPGDEPDRILEAAGDLDVHYIVLTHAHFDHVGAVKEVKDATGAEVALHEDDVEVYASVRDQAAIWGFNLDDLPSPDVLLKEGDEILFGSLSFTVIHTPGHSPGSICLYGEGVLITGDTLFAGSVGRTDFPGGSLSLLRESFRRIMTLPDSVPVLSAHGAATTIGREKAENMFSAEFLD
jgi:glyoxylase-like metal-dependent hydrolase (beta-lactamase superfamily II)